MNKRIICFLLSACVVIGAAQLCSCFGGSKKKSSSTVVEIETVTETEPQYKQDGVGFNPDGSGALTVVSVDSGTEEIVIPAKVSGMAVKSVSHSALKHSSVKSVTISKGVTEIEKYAFALCSQLEEVVLPEGLESIGDNAFFACRKLSSIKLPSTVKTLGMHCFDASGLTQVSIPEGVKEIGEYAFAECPSLTKFTLNSADTKVYDTIFNQSPNVEVTAPKGSPLINIAKTSDIKFTEK